MNLDTTSIRELSTMNNQAAEKLEAEGIESLSDLLRCSFEYAGITAGMSIRETEQVITEVRQVAGKEAI